jgi:zinc D-Ala-D-Ala dipeptidase
LNFFKPYCKVKNLCDHVSNSLHAVKISLMIRHFFKGLNFVCISMVAVLALFGCTNKEDKSVSSIIKHKVYIIHDTVSEIPKMIPRDTSYLEYLFKNHQLIDILELDTSIKVDLRYASTNNFLGRGFYDGLRKAYFPCEVAIKICNAQYLLKQVNNNYSLLILDAVRPLHIQQMMWDSLNLKPDLKRNYLASPQSTSLHNYGCAVDLTIVDLETAQELDMGTAFDFFGKLSQPVYEGHFLKTKELSTQAHQNRLLLRKIMRLAKFNAINSEWWHFSAFSKTYAAANFELVK